MDSIGIMGNLHLCIFYDASIFYVYLLNVAFLQI